MQNTIAKDTLREYVKENEVVFQSFGNLMEVANEAEKENREELLSYFDEASSVEIYPEGRWFIKDEFADLDGWATQDDVLFLIKCCMKTKLKRDRTKRLNTTLKSQ